MTDLKTKLLEADGGSRELDALIHMQLFDPTEGYNWDFSAGELAQNLWMRRPSTRSIHVDVPRYTTSLDAALALVEEVLPQEVTIRMWRMKERFAFDIFGSRHGLYDRRGRHKSPAIALCLALLSALEKEPHQ